ncbi:MAG: inositol monophosphatase family protein [Hyphomonadaceae bacterium]
MTLQSAASDLELIASAVREAGVLARDLARKRLDIKSKGEEGPVTNVDLAVDALLAERLRSARPDYGWLSEESPDEPAARINKARTFMLDPIDGTAALISKSPQWTISIGIVEGERAFAGAIYNPQTDELFLGAQGEGASLNGRPIHASLFGGLDGARMIGQKNRFADKRWDKPWPKMEIIERQSIAYRLALVASSLGDAAVLFGWKHDWDIAAGAAIVEAAGGRVSDLWGGPLAFNQEIPRTPGVAASGAILHPLLIERTSAFPDPRAKAPAESP